MDRPFRYRIPEDLIAYISLGSVVKVPFGKGNSVRTGYVIGLADSPNYDITKIKDIAEVDDAAVSVESKLIQLAAWMRHTYGSTMITALKTVMPVKEKVGERKAKIDIREHIPEFRPIEKLEMRQQEVVDTFVRDLDDLGSPITYMLHGVTGSGKTEVYIKMAEEVINRGQDVIVLVPEIALTYQTVARFSSYFQDSISILNSQLSKGEKYREFMKAREGRTHIMIGPRSALFAPFQNLGLIIIDEEHDTAYKSEKTPKYHAREVAIERARLEGAKVVLGSATPSIGSYYKAKQGEYKLLEMTERVNGAVLPEVELVDLRAELKQGNRNILSRALYSRMREAFDKGEQAMVFLNRRGYNSFVSCRSCGEVIKCPNCDVSLSLHGRAKLMCHYCGHVEYMPDNCPSCHSNLIGGCGAGTEMLEEAIQKFFPDIKTLRMDGDTTAQKGSHGEIIKKFREGQADCLIGTQMIVKGHDFPKVTVVGNILADIGLFDADFESAERTFDLMVQAAGRAGRGNLKGHVVIQTYQPEHYALETAATQDYKAFYEYEMSYRKLLRYPPVSELLMIMVSSENEGYAIAFSQNIANGVRDYLKELEKSIAAGMDSVPPMKLGADASEVPAIFDLIGPAEASIYRIKNIYRRVIYIKADNVSILERAMEKSDSIVNEMLEVRGIPSSVIEVQYDLNPMRIV